MSIERMSHGFRKWKETTSISPSSRHIRHYKCLLIPEVDEKIMRLQRSINK